MQKFKFSYDKKNDDLFLHNPKTKSKGSVEFGDLILDYSGKKELVGIQLMNASKMIKDITGKNLNDIKKVLNDLKECKVDIKSKKNLLIVKVFLHSEFQEIIPVISIPSIQEPSPSLAYA